MAQLPPGPRGPAAVTTARFAYRPVDQLLAWHRRYGDVFTVKLLAFGVGVYVADTDAIRDLFSGDQSDLAAGEANAPLGPVLGAQSLLLLDGKEHLRHRRLLLPPFNASARYREVIAEVAEAEVARWRVGETFAMRDRMRALTFEVIARVVFGVAEPERIARMQTSLAALMDSASLMFAPEKLRVDLGPRSPWGRFRRRLADADALVYEEIARRRTVPDLDERTDVLSLMLRARDEDGEPLSDLALRDELMTMLLAGHETTATGLAFAFDLLPRHPEVIARLRDGEEEYLEAVVTEVLRLRPVIDAAERTLLAPREICGYTLPAGIRVYPAIAVVQRRADLYPDPDAFKPERFLGTTPSAPTWLPFGGGIRRCIGAALARAEMAEVIRCVVRSVDLDCVRPKPDPVTLKGITCAPVHGTEVRVVRKPATAQRPEARDRIAVS